MGQQIVDREGGVFYVKKKWKIVTTRPRLVEVMAPYARIPEHVGPADFRPCSGKVCADSAFYTPLFAELVWRALRAVVVMPARTRADPVPEGCLPAGKPSLPLWCTRKCHGLACEDVSANSAPHFCIPSKCGGLLSTCIATTLGYGVLHQLLSWITATSAIHTAAVC